MYRAVPPSRWFSRRDLADVLAGDERRLDARVLSDAGAEVGRPSRGRRGSARVTDKFPLATLAALLKPGANLYLAERDIEQSTSFREGDESAELINALKRLVTFLRHGELPDLADVDMSGAQAGADAENALGGTALLAHCCMGLLAVFAGDFHAANALFQACGPTFELPELGADLRLLGAIALAYGSPSSDRTVVTLENMRAGISQGSEREGPALKGKRLLLEAELARLSGETLAALRFYDEAGEAALAAGIAHEAGLAHELAARLCKSSGLTTAARQHTRLAQDSFHRWGAHAKARLVDGAKPESDGGGLAGPATPMRIGADSFDAAALMETVQALSEEILPDRLICRLMDRVLVCSGAHYGSLILLQNGRLQIKATARIVESEVYVEVNGIAPPEAPLPDFVIDRALNSGGPVLIRDVAKDRSLDAWVQAAARPVCSLLCVPIVKRKAHGGLLVLENAMANDAFSDGAVETLKVLARQAAISLETARLYAGQIEGNAKLAQSEASLRRVRAELARTSQLTAMGSLAASIAHEINQPLAVIASNAGAGLRWLRQSTPNVPEAIASLNDIRDDGLRAGGIVKALRALAKQGPAALSRVSIDEVVRHVLEIMAPDIEAKDIVLSLDLKALDAFIFGDSVQLQQLLLNLITNAVEAIDVKGPTTRRVLISSVREGVAVVVRIIDSGPGLSRDALDQVFDPFYTTKEGGMGMGLAISRSIAEAHGGTLVASCNIDSGTTFEFRIPLMAIAEGA